MIHSLNFLSVWSWLVMPFSWLAEITTSTISIWYQPASQAHNITLRAHLCVWVQVLVRVCVCLCVRLANANSHVKPANISQQSISWPLNWAPSPLQKEGGMLFSWAVLCWRVSVFWTLCFSACTGGVSPYSGHVCSCEACGFQGWVVRLWWKSDVCVMGCVSWLCVRGEGPFVLLIREVGPTD